MSFELVVLVLVELDFFERLHQQLLRHEVPYVLEQQHHHFEVACRHVLLQTCADAQSHLDKEEVSVEEILVPNLRTGLKREDVGVESYNPLEEKDRAGEIGLFEDAMHFGQLLLHEGHEQVEDNVHLLHVERVEVEQQVSVHQI